MTKKLQEAETTEPVSEPYPGIDPGDTETIAKMDSCVEGVMAKDDSLDKSAAIAICRASVLEGKDLDEAMKTFKLGTSTEAPAGAPVAEAATVKSKVRAAMKALDELLGERALPEALRSTVKDIREKFKTKTWADLAAEIPELERNAESEPNTSTKPQEVQIRPGGGSPLTREAALKIVATYFG